MSSDHSVRSPSATGGVAFSSPVEAPSAKKSCRGKSYNRLLVKGYLLECLDFVKKEKVHPTDDDKVALLNKAYAKSLQLDPEGELGNHRSNISVRSADLFVQNLKKAVQRQRAAIATNSVNMASSRQRHIYDCGEVLEKIAEASQGLPPKKRRSRLLTAPHSRKTDSSSETQSDVDERDEFDLDDEADGRDEKTDEEEGEKEVAKGMEEEAREAGEARPKPDLSVEVPEEIAKHDEKMEATTPKHLGRGQRLNRIMVVSILERMIEFMERKQRRPFHDEAQKLMLEAFCLSKERDPNGSVGKHRDVPPDVKSFAAIRRNLKASSFKLLQAQAEGKKSSDPALLTDRQRHVLNCGNLIDRIERLETGLVSSTGRGSTGEMNVADADAETEAEAEAEPGMEMETEDTEMGSEPEMETVETPVVSGRRGKKRKLRKEEKHAKKTKSSWKHKLRLMEANEARREEILVLMKQQQHMQQHLMEMQSERLETQKRHDEMMIEALRALTDALGTSRQQQQKQHRKQQQE